MTDVYPAALESVTLGERENTQSPLISPLCWTVSHLGTSLSTIPASYPDVWIRIIVPRTVKVVLFSPLSLACMCAVFLSVSSICWNAVLSVLRLCGLCSSSSPWLRNLLGDGYITTYSCSTFTWTQTFHLYFWYYLHIFVIWSLKHIYLYCDFFSGPFCGLFQVSMLSGGCVVLVYLVTPEVIQRPLGAHFQHPFYNLISNSVS